MNKTLVAIILGIIALIIAVPILVVLFLVLVSSEVTPGEGHDNVVPSDLEAMTIHDRLAIQLTWTPVEPGTAAYVLQRSDDDGATWQDLGELAPGESSFIDSEGLEDNVTYLYRIYATDPAGGHGYSNTTSATATDLPQPQ
jgi:hypothetical protein